MREMLQRRHDRMAAVQSTGLRTSPRDTTAAPGQHSETLQLLHSETASYKSTATAASRAAERSPLPFTSAAAATTLINALSPSPGSALGPSPDSAIRSSTVESSETKTTTAQSLNSRVDAAIAAGQSSTAAARQARTSPPGSPKNESKVPTARYLSRRSAVLPVELLCTSCSLRLPRSRHKVIY
jgi:hypothetical protein